MPGCAGQGERRHPHEKVECELDDSQLVDRARASGLQLTGEGGPRQQLTKRVLESALGAKSRLSRSWCTRQV